MVYAPMEEQALEGGWIPFTFDSGGRAPQNKHKWRHNGYLVLCMYVQYTSNELCENAEVCEQERSSSV